MRELSQENEIYILDGETEQRPKAERKSEFQDSIKLSSQIVASVTYGFFFFQQHTENCFYKFNFFFCFC